MQTKSPLDTIDNTSMRLTVSAITGNYCLNVSGDNTTDRQEAVFQKMATDCNPHLPFNEKSQSNPVTSRIEYVTGSKHKKNNVLIF